MFKKNQILFSLFFLFFRKKNTIFKKCIQRAPNFLDGLCFLLYYYGWLGSFDNLNQFNEKYVRFIPTFQISRPNPIIKEILCKGAMRKTYVKKVTTPGCTGIRDFWGKKSQISAL